MLLMPDGVSPPSIDAIMPAAVLLTNETPQLRKQWTTLADSVPPTARGVAALASQGVPPARVVLDAATFAAVSRLDAGTPMAFTSDAQRVTTHTWNVVARLAGSDEGGTGETVVLSAHLDHLGNRGAGEDTIFNGADDDASGTVAVMALAEALAAGRRPRRSVVFAWFGSEEAGGFGSQYFTERPPVPLAQIVANLQFEMIGRPDTAVPAQNLWMTGFDRSTLGPELAQRGARLVRDPRPEQNFFERSDNIRLARRGVIAHAVSSFGLHTDYHRPSDELRHIDYAHMTAAIQSMLEPVRWLADSTFRPEWLPGQRP
jgi:Zn-dependent M28 family amino/carboxypeptidase